MDNWTFAGIVVNPKLAIPCMVWSRDNEVIITGLTGENLGEGYFNVGVVVDDEHKEMARMGEPEEFTGFPRVHTPRGVTHKEMGYGTALYTGLALVAKLNAEERIPMTTEFMEPGVSSWRPRKPEAEKWWERAKARGDAKHVEGMLAKEGSFAESDSDDPGWIPAADLTKRRDVHVREWSLAMEYDYAVPAEADVYEYDTANEKNLVAVLIDEAKIGVPDPVGVNIADLNTRLLLSNVSEANLPLIANLNVSYLREWEEDGKRAFDALLRLAKRLKISPEDSARLYYRFERGTDVEPERTATPNRGRGRVLEYRLKTYGRNPTSPDKFLADEVKTLVEQRADLGLDRYSQDDV